MDTKNGVHRLHVSENGRGLMSTKPGGDLLVKMNHNRMEAGARCEVGSVELVSASTSSYLLLAIPGW